MKYYESHYEEYTNAIKLNNIHIELSPIISGFPKNIKNIENMIIYGPPGVGKYSQALSIIQKYSPSELKYDKKITAQTDKQQYIYRISDIHYEIDMSLLGCNSKIVWHEVFFQIVDIVSVKQDKVGIILCKNFHLIHSELLDIFYSYMQQHNHTQTNINLKFFIITEHISFLPSNILNASYILRIGRPSTDQYKKISEFSYIPQVNGTEDVPDIRSNTFIYKLNEKISQPVMPVKRHKPRSVLDAIDVDGIVNIKETKAFVLINDESEIPKDIFNIICDNIIAAIINHKNMSFPNFRDILYDILTYNLDVPECLWYIIRHLIQNDLLKDADISPMMQKVFIFLKYYNNNYRPIYHLESIMFYIINRIHRYDEL